MEDTIRIANARKAVSRFGFSLCGIILISTVLQLLWVWLLPLIFGADSWICSSSWGMWIGNFLPMYGIAMPLSLQLLRPVEACPPEKSSLRGKDFLFIIPICAFMMYGGNLVGTLLSMILSGGMAQNAILDLALDNNPLKILVMVILAPTLEEVIFRKMLIDRTRRYGEKLAVILSAVTFGLMHQNLFQFFYAFGLGLVFAYVYVRTGKLRYCIIFHACINFLGSVFAPWLLSQVDMELLANLGSSPMTEDLIAQVTAILPGLLAFAAYAMLLVTTALVGLILFIIKVRDLTWKESEQPLPKGSIFRTVYLNPGMLVFIAACLVFIVLALI